MSCTAKFSSRHVNPVILVGSVWVSEGWCLNAAWGVFKGFQCASAPLELVSTPLACIQPVYYQPVLGFTCPNT